MVLKCKGCDCMHTTIEVGMKAEILAEGTAWQFVKAKRS
jgi:hypothetical protein